MRTLRDEVLARTRRDPSGCLLWTGQMSHGVPTFTVGCRRGPIFAAINARSFIAERTNELTTFTCGNRAKGRRTMAEFMAARSGSA